MTYYFDMDGVLANFHKDFDFRKRAQQAMNRTWIANLEPFMENINLVASLIEAGENVYILTAAANEDAKLGKIDWLAKYLPMVTIEKFICIVGSGKKIDYIKEDGMLIDDDYKKKPESMGKSRSTDLLGRNQRCKSSFLKRAKKLFFYLNNQTRLFSPRFCGLFRQVKNFYAPKDTRGCAKTSQKKLKNLSKRD